MNDNLRPEHLVVRPLCAVCGAPASSIELVPPGDVPLDWDNWPDEHRRVAAAHHDPTAWRLLFKSVGGGNGLGRDLAAEEAVRWAAAFSEPLEYDKVHRLGLYDDAGFCNECRVSYCLRHWKNSDWGGYGRCPHGHSKSLDPHWSPEAYGK